MVAWSDTEHRPRRPNWEWLGWFLSPGDLLRPKAVWGDELTVRRKATLLYEYCLTSDKKVSEAVHSLFIIAEHYSGDNPDDIAQPAQINGIPPLFKDLAPDKKAEYCYRQVIDVLSLEALPVTVESLNATKRADPKNPWSSDAGRFVRLVTISVGLSLIVMFGLWSWDVSAKLGLATEPKWVAFGCLGALIHLLNHALTTTRLQTFELSETRKIWPRLMLGGMFGFIAPWILIQTGTIGTSLTTELPPLLESSDTFKDSPASIAAFFAGYSVRFSTGLLERLMKALIPETKTKA